MQCVVFRCSRKEEMYLYLPHQDDQEQMLKDLSPDLVALTGELVKVIDLELTPERKLARVNVEDVIASLKEKKYYLQMPPNDVLIKDVSMLHNPDDSL